MKNNKRVFLLIATVTFSSPFFSLGQNGINGNEKMKMLHNESVGDKYLPNQYDNKKVSPAYRYKHTHASRLSVNSIFTTQVNVNATGQNIIGDAANEPNIAVNPLNPNEMVIGWRQFDNVSSNFRQAGWSYTTNAGITWTFPGVIEPGIFRSDPVLDYDSSGIFYYNSLTRDNLGNFSCQVFKSINGGSNWNNGTAAGGGDKQWMAIDRTQGVGSGNIYSAWTSNYSSCVPGYFTRSTDGAGTFDSCTVADGNPALGTEAVGNSGELYIVGRSNQLDSLVVAKSMNAQIPGSTISWNPPVSVFMDGTIGGASVNPAGLLGQANIDVDRSNGPGHGNVYVLASIARLSNSDPGDVMFAKSTDGGLTWSAPIRINDDTSVTNTQWMGTMSVAPNGRIDVVWLDTRNDPSGLDSSALYYSYSTNQGTTWSVNEMLSGIFDPHTGYPNQTKMGDYFDMVSDNSGAHLAWTNTLNGEEDVYYSHIIPQITTTVNDFSYNANFSVFPNPSFGVFLITGESQRFQVEIFSLLGEKVYSMKNIKTKIEINFSVQPAGIYFLKITNQDGNIVVKKLIKE
jgi:hypothetical protein